MERCFNQDSLLNDLHRCQIKLSNICDCTISSYPCGSVLFVASKNGLSSTWVFDASYNEDKITMMLKVMLKEMKMKFGLENV